jgi:hypothetical protein
LIFNPALPWTLGAMRRHENVFAEQGIVSAVRMIHVFKIHG